MSHFSVPQGGHIHLMGICGTAMASLAGLLKQMGYKVTGSDQNVYPPMSTQLEKLGIPILEGYKKENLHPAPDLVIVGNVITRQHEEAQALLQSSIPYTSLPKAIGDFIIQDRNSIVITGTHGKTTTTAMVSWVAECCGKKPGFLIGGLPLNFETSFRLPEDNWFVIEGDEYDTAFFDKVPKFLHYKPKYVIISSIEFDHADIYNSLDEIKEAFRQLIKKIPSDGLIVASAEDPVVQEVIQEAACSVKTYGFSEGDYVISERRVEEEKNHLLITDRHGGSFEVALQMFGPHNSLNALATFVLAKELGWELGSLIEGLASFQGVKRRQEILGRPQGIVVVEDFAHHPTAVKLTIQAMRERFPGRKIFAVFEPRSATSRRRVFQEDYVKALDLADEVVVPPPFNQSKIKEEDRFSSQELVSDIGEKAFYLPEVSDIVAHLKNRAQPGDVILIMSNGAFGGIYQKLLTALKD